jgi:hypothetical protein
VSTRDRQTQVWREASQDLGLEFIAPFTLPDGEDTLTYLGLLREFGGKRGTLIIFDELVDLENQSRLCGVAETHGYGFSCIELGSSYDRANMIELLKEWGWCGLPDRTPAWYRGCPEDDDDA